MEAIYNDSDLRDLRGMIEEQELCQKRLFNIGRNMKRKVFKMIGNATNLLENYRYVSHLQNELIGDKKINDKKNVALPEKKEVLNDFFDDLLSFIQAEKRYIVFCLRYKFIEGERESKPKERLKVQAKLQWAATKVDLVELIYALYYARCINNGEAEIKNITEAFELLSILI